MYDSNRSQNDLALPTELDIRERLVLLEELLSNPHSECAVETLLDILVSLINECRRHQKIENNEYIANFFLRYEKVAAKLKILRRNFNDFSFVAQIGRGAFGRVNLVREKATGRVLAMKVMHKSRMISHRADFWAERQIMSSSISPWIVHLYYAFQDSKNLYMVMEYVPGGNLVSWMDEVEVMSEASCRFYAAEVVLALTDLHKMGFIHRDLKPDNLLLDAGGHLKLADFGTSIFVDPETGMVRSQTAVGTPDYISPEVLLSQSAAGGEYGFEVDWWALGVLIYEMLYGETPFYSESLINTYSRIMSHQKSLSFPTDLEVSDAAISLIKNLLCERSHRIGNFPSDHQRHVYNAAWFSESWMNEQFQLSRLDPSDLGISNWTWENIRASPTPFQPQLSNETDIVYFQGLGLDLETEDSTDESVGEAPISDEDQTNSANEDINSQQVDKNTRKTKRIRNQSTNQATEPSTAMNQSSCSSNSNFSFQAEDLNFAGFSFASSYPNKLCLFSDLYLREADREKFSVLLPQLDSTSFDVKTSSISSQTGGIITTEISKANSTENTFRSTIKHLETQLEDALHENNEHLKEIEVLSDRLLDAVNLRKTAEAELASREVLLREQADEFNRNFQAMKAENGAMTSKLEAEVTRWRGLAEMEESARKRATEIADRVVSRGSTPGPIATSCTLSNSSTPVINNTTDSLLIRIKELAERAQRSEAISKESQDQLDAERIFTKLYKDACAEKSDQLAEYARKEARLKDSLDAANILIDRLRREGDASKRALNEEHDKTSMLNEKLKKLEDMLFSANQRSQQSNEESAKLRELLHQKEHELSQTEKLVAVEKVKCSAAVNKIKQILSGESAEAIELMMLADNGASSSTGVIGNGLATGLRSKGNVPVQVSGTTAQQLHRRNLTQQHLVRQLDRKNKKLTTDLDQLQIRHSTIVKDLRNKIDQLCSKQAKMEQELNKSKEEIKLLKLSKQKQYSTESPDNFITHSSNTVTSRANSGNIMRLRNNHTMGKTSVGFFKQDSLKTGTEKKGLVRRSSFGDRRIHATNLLNNEAQLMSPLVASKSGSLHGVVENVLIVGFLEIPVTSSKESSSSSHTSSHRTGTRRKKQLLWTSKHFQLTPSRLIIRDLVGHIEGTRGSRSNDSKVLMPFLDETLNTTASPLPSEVSKTIFLDLPLNAIVHVRNVTACDVLHASEQDLPRIFQIIYDQTLMQHQNVGITTSNVGQNASSTTTSSSSSSSELPMAAQQLLIQQNNQQSKTLPRKLSFSAAANSLFGGNTQEIDPQNQPKHIKSSSIPSTDSSISLTADMVTEQDASSSSSLPPGTKLVTTGTGAAPLMIYQGHLLQRIQFRSPTVCDLCHKACWSVLSPSACLQCQHCQIKLHTTHLERRDGLRLPPCAKATAIRLFRAKDEAEKFRWLNLLTSTLQSLRQNQKTTSPSSNVEPISNAPRELTRSMSVVYRHLAPNSLLEDSSTASDAIKSASRPDGGYGLAPPRVISKETTP